MTPSILIWIEKTRRNHPWIAGDVIEIGSFDINGNPRGLFGDASSYTGVDCQSGPTVDVLCEIESLPNRFISGTFDTVICCETLEHVSDPIKALHNIRQLVKVGGYLLVTSPANGFPEHRYPRDYFRLMPDAWHEIVFNGLCIVNLTTTQDYITCGLARK